MTVRFDRALERLDQALADWSPPLRPAPVLVLMSALTAGLVSAVVLGDVFGGGLGINVVIAATAVALAVLPTVRAAGRVNRTGTVFALTALCLVSVGAVRDSLWVAGVCMAAG